MRLFACLLLCSVLWLPAVALPAAPAATPRLKIITTLFPLYDMARSLGGERAEVYLLIPPGVEAHSFEPKFGDIVRINQADVFIYTGELMEPWVTDLLKGATSKKLVVVEAGRGTKIFARDPHLWLDFDNARTMVDNLAAALSARDHAAGNFYRRNAGAYKNKLSQLDRRFRAALAKCRQKEIVYGGHYAFGYLARRYGLKYLAAQGLSPDAEPAAADLARLVDQIRRQKIKYVFYEELTSPKIAETLAGETGARLLLLNAGHNLTRDQFKKGTTFFDILQSDLDNLKTGLEYQE